MITGPNPQMFDAAAFAARLSRATRGVMRLRRHGSDIAGFTSATCWLITADLVIAPAYAVSTDEDAAYTCLIGETEMHARLVYRSAADAEQAPALLRLPDRPAGLEALPLSTREGSAGAHIFLVHHARARPEAALSIGALSDATGERLRYVADSEPGSGGAPVFGGAWTVIGMHMVSRMDGGRVASEGVSISAILAALRDSPVWAEIAEHHRLADVDAASRAVRGEGNVAQELTTTTLEGERETLSPAALSAAVRWSFDPETLTAQERAQVEPLVVEPTARRWILSPAARTQALRSAGSLDALRLARGPGRARDTGQAVIDDILAGPPYRLDGVSEGELSFWLQATRWFADVVPGLPTPSVVHRSLERRRVRSRLELVGGQGFRGRDAELAELRDWFADAAAGPLAVTGIGGVGKSALVARFALDLADGTVILWLDFDRADLAADDAVSVLRPVFEQIATQLDGFTAPEVDEGSWNEELTRLGEALAPALARRPPPLLVLDGFEVAQHAQQHREIWDVLERLVEAMPQLHVLVSGRAPIGRAKLRGRDVRTVVLTGLTPGDAAAWLRDAGITDRVVVKKVLELTRGVPLALRLAVRMVRDAGGSEDELPDDLPDALVQGFLYQRILDRVIDPALKDVAQDALVLRRVTPEIAAALLPLPEGMSAAELFERLSRELALTGRETEPALDVALPGSGVLRLRPEVRMATVQLLERVAAGRVADMDRRAAAWYAGRDVEDPVIAAELVYHRLRIRDLKGATSAWRPGCGPLLADELDTLSAPAVKWLERRLRDVAATAATNIRIWEADAAERIRELLQRGVLHSIPAVLAERAQRSAASQLIVYDAWMRWRAGDGAGARKLLRGHIRRREAALLDARVVAAIGEHPVADKRLAQLTHVRTWNDRPFAEIDALVVQAARIHLTIDVVAELLLAGDPKLDESPPAASPFDVVTSALAARLVPSQGAESPIVTLQLPAAARDLRAFASTIDGVRGAPPGQTGIAELDHLLALAKQRWNLVSTTTFLHDACENIVSFPPLTLQRLALIGTVAPFAALSARGLNLVAEARPLATVVDRGWSPEPAPAPDSNQLAAARSLLRASGLEEDMAPVLWPREGRTLISDPTLRMLLFHVLAPSPLDVLVRQVLGLPDTLPLVDA